MAAPAALPLSWPGNAGGADGPEIHWYAGPEMAPGCQHTGISYGTNLLAEMPAASRGAA